jgi:drug/metabolite transporter (DMT)-like permease
MSRITATLLILLAATIWGFTFVVQKWATLGESALAPLTFTGLRFLLGAAVITPLTMLETRRHVAPVLTSHRLGFIACGVMLFLGSWLQQRGIVQTSVSNAGFFTGIYVVITPFVSWALFRLKPHALIWPAVAAATGGICLLNGGSLSHFDAGDLSVIASSVFWALQITLVGVFAMRSARPLLLAWVQFVVAGLLGMMLAVLFTSDTLTRMYNAWPELLWAGGMSVGVAFTLQVIAQRHVQPAVAAVIMGSEMLFAALAGALFLHERLSVSQLWGGGLIFIAIVLAEAVPQLESKRVS